MVPKIKGEVVKDDKQIEEFKTAFVTKAEKIPRTPPEEDQRRYMEKRVLEQHQQLFQAQQPPAPFGSNDYSLPTLPNTGAIHLDGGQ